MSRSGSYWLSLRQKRRCLDIPVWTGHAEIRLDFNLNTVPSFPVSEFAAQPFNMRRKMHP